MQSFKGSGSRRIRAANHHRNKNKMAQGFKFGDSTVIKFDPSILSSKGNDDFDFQLNADYQEYTRLKSLTTTYKWKIDSIEDILNQQSIIRSKEFTLLPHNERKLYLELYTDKSPDNPKSHSSKQSSNVYDYSYNSSSYSDDTRHNTSSSSVKKSLRMSLVTVQPMTGYLQVSVRYGVMNFNDQSVKLVQEVKNVNRYTNVIVDDIKQCKPNLEFFCKIKHDQVVTSKQDSPMSKHCLSLPQSLELLMGADGFTQPDFEFVCGDRKINIHKCVLEKQSPEFAALVQTKMKEGITREVEIQDVCYETMYEVVRFIYTGKIEDDDLLPELLNVAEKYNLRELKRECENRLYENLIVENAMECLYLADIYNAEQLEKRVLHFILMNKEAVTKTEGYQTFAKKSSPLSKIIAFL